MNNVVDERVAGIFSSTYYKELLMDHLTLALERFAVKNPDEGTLEEATERFVERFPIEKWPIEKWPIHGDPQERWQPQIRLCLNETKHTIWVAIDTRPSLTLKVDYTVVRDDILLDAVETHMYFKDPFRSTSTEMVEFELETGYPYIFSEELLDGIVSKVLENPESSTNLHQAGAVIYRFSS